MSVFPVLRRQKVMYLGWGGELEHLRKSESRYHEGTIFCGQRDAGRFAWWHGREVFTSARAVKIVKANQDTWASVSRKGPAGIGTPRYLPGTINPAWFRRSASWRTSKVRRNQGKKGCRRWKSYGYHSKEIRFNPPGDKKSGEGFQYQHAQDLPRSGTWYRQNFLTTLAQNVSSQWGAITPWDIQQCHEILFSVKTSVARSASGPCLVKARKLHRFYSVLQCTGQGQQRRLWLGKPRVSQFGGHWNITSP